MALNSFCFIVYLFVIITIMSILQILRTIRKRKIYEKIQIVFLLIFSYIYTCFYDIRFCICLILVTLFTYFSALLIEKKEKFKRTILTISILTLIGTLAYFKYSEFFINNIKKVLGQDSVTLKIILPIGISFYIFSTISYLIDVYRKTYKAEKNFINFALFVSFFPKLTAGPILRGNVFLPQVKEYKGINLESFSKGIQIFIFGLFKKIVLADRLGVFVDNVFNAPIAFDTFTVFLAVLSYSMQIYFDFSGYSDMSIGISKILGFEYPANFNLPYISKNFSEFWKRWHISLSSWFQDYIYIPLGGSKKGEMRTYINLILVMLVSGIWHGAGWTFIIWGLFYGIGSCVNRVMKKHGNSSANKNNIKEVCKICITFIFVTLFWVVFRATDFNNAIQLYKQLFTIHGGISQPYTWSFFALIVLMIATISAVITSRKNDEEKVRGYYPILNLNKFSSLIVFFTFIGLTIMMGYFGNTAFIYGKF